MNDLPSALETRTQAIKRSYQLRKPAIRFTPSKLDSSEYPGKIIYRKSPQTGPDDGASAQRRPSSAPLGLSKSHISASLRNRPASIEFYRGASYLKVQIEKDPEQSKPPKKRGEVTEFTAASRRRMLDFMAKIDNTLIPLFVTLTYPDNFPAYHETFKSHLDLLGQRIRRRWPEAFIVWKLEFKERQSGENKGKLAPHYHLFVYGVPAEFPFKREVGEFYSLKVRPDRFDPAFQVWKQYVLGQFVELWQFRESDDQPKDNLKAWMSRNWFEIVGSNDPRHFRAGTRVEELRSTKGAFYYASKNYMVKAEDCSGLEHKPGRYWCVIGRSNVKFGKREVHEITAKQAFTIQRTIRRYRRANTDPKKRRFLRGSWLSAKLYCNVDYWIERLNCVTCPGRFLAFGEKFTTSEATTRATLVNSSAVATGVTHPSNGLFTPSPGPRAYFKIP